MQQLMRLLTLLLCWVLAGMHKTQHMYLRYLCTTTGTMSASVEELIGAMTLEEKVSQLNTDSPAIPHLNITAFNWWQGIALVTTST